MNKMHNIELLKRTNTIFIEKTDDSLLKNSANMLKGLLVELAQLGYTLSGDLISVIENKSDEQFKHLHSFLVKSLKVIVGASVDYKPLYKNFPYDMPDAQEHYESRVKGYIENIFGLESSSCTHLSCGHFINTTTFDISQFNACPICQHQVEELDGGNTPKRPDLEAISPLKIIGLAHEGAIYDILSNLVSAKSSISDTDKIFISEIFAEDGDSIICKIPESITMKEHVALVSALAIKHTNNYEDLLLKHFNTATDVLRLAFNLSGVESIVVKNAKFKLSGKERNIVSTLLDKLNNPLEDMNRNRSAFISLGKVLHIGQKTKRFPSIAVSFDVLRNKPKTIKTFNKEVEAEIAKILGVTPTPKGTKPNIKAKETIFTAFELPNARIGDLNPSLSELLKTLPLTSESPKNTVTQIKTPLGDTSKTALERLVNLLSKRPGEFARKLDLMLSNANKESSKYILKMFNVVSAELPTPLLLTLQSHFKSRDFKSEFRYFIPKGNVAKIEFKEGDTRNTIEKWVITEVIGYIDLELMERFSKLPSMGDVLISKDLKRVLVPLTQRSASESLIALERGSRIKVNPKTNMLRFFQYWKGDVDLDLSISGFTDKWDEICSVYYGDYEEAQADGWALYSGDILSAPEGAAECIDINIKKCKDKGVRYLTMFVNAYSSQPFSDFEAMAGIMERIDDKTGELFEPRTVTNKFNLEGKTNTTIPLILDLDLMEFIWVDVSQGTFRGGSNIKTAESKIMNTNRVLELLVDTKPNLFDLFYSHAKTRANSIDVSQVEGKHYDVVFDMKMATNKDDILANWL